MSDSSLSINYLYKISGWDDEQVVYYENYDLENIVTPVKVTRLVTLL